MDFFKDNWFVILIAAVIIGFVAYFVYDQNKDNVTVKKVDGQDVVATLKDADITAESLYENGEHFDAALLYTLYKNAVIDQSVETTDDLKNQAKSMESTILANAKSMYSDYELMLTKELAGYGFASVDQLYDYCLVNAKEGILDKEYIKEHYKSLKKSVEEAKPRIISIIKMDASDPDNLTEEEAAKQKQIDDMIESDSFAKAATTFSTDVTTAANGGQYGYVDSNTTSLDSGLLSKVLELKPGEMTEWIRVSDPSSGTVSLYKAVVDEDNLDTIYESEDLTIQNGVLSAFISANPTLKAQAIAQAASKLDIKFDDDSIKEKVESQIQSALGENE